MSSSRSLSGEPLCLYSAVLDKRFQALSDLFPVLRDLPRRFTARSSELSSVAAWPLCSEAWWWRSCLRFSRFSAHGPNFCQFTLWKAIMQCRLPPTYKNIIEITNMWNNSNVQIIVEVPSPYSTRLPSWFCDTECLSLYDECPSILGSEYSDPSQYQPIWLKMRLECVHHIYNLTKYYHSIKLTILFTVDCRVFPAWFTNENPVFHLIKRQWPPVKIKKERNELSFLIRRKRYCKG